MSSGAKIHTLLEHLTVPETEAAVEAWLIELPDTQKVQVVSFVNAHAVNLMVKDTSLSDALINSDVLFRDGLGMKILMRWLGLAPGLNLNGTDLIPRILTKYCSVDSDVGTNKTIAVLGTQEPWLSKGCDAIAQLGGNVVLRLDGFKEDSAYVDALKQAPASLVILAMGMPKQERVSMLLRDAIAPPCTIINGGAYIDFLAERVSRAPESWRKLGMEWLFRLLQEPKRLFGRYVVGNMTFLLRAFALRMNKPNT